MKTQILSKSLFVLFIAGFLTTSAFAYNGRGRNVAYTPQDASMICLQQLPNLTPEQSEQIAALFEAHQSEMLALRTERRSTADFAEKNAVRAEMDELVKKHREDVKALLTDEQIVVYNQLYRNDAYGNQRMGMAGRRGARKVGVGVSNFNGQRNATMRGTRRGGNSRGYGWR